MNDTKKQKRRKIKKRREERVAASLPVYLAKEKGRSRDISATGLFFETEAPFEQGSTLNLVVELDTPADRHQRRRLLKYQGEIVRVEQHGTRVGVAVKITDSILRYVQD